VLTLPRLYTLIDKAVLDARGVGVRTYAEALREAGVTLVQYRDKAGAPQEILRASAEIAAVFAGVEATLILNDRADLAVLAGWSGVHVGQRDLSPRDAKAVVRGRTLVRPHPCAEDAHEWGTRMVGVVGVSTHTDEQVRAANASEADYVAIGPVFATATKADAETVVGLEGVRRARALKDGFLKRRPLVAIGGITRENARSVIEAGADSIAVISALMPEGRSVVEAAREMMALLG
jgi:thiamine-phosphate pyrophosphorylase